MVHLCRSRELQSTIAGTSEHEMSMWPLPIPKGSDEVSESQATAILAHLKAGHTLTPREALNLFQCNRLAARIRELREAGYDIRTDMIVLPSGKRVAQYRLVWQPQLRLVG